MKKHLAILLVAAGVAAANAQQVNPGSAALGDVILGFQDTVKNIDYIVDLGPGSNLASFSSINVGTDLAAAFGSDWANDPNLMFGLFGINTARSAIWASSLSGSAVFGANPASALNITKQHFQTLLTAFNTTGTALTKGVKFTGVSGLTAYTSWTLNSPTGAPTPAFAVYTQSLEAPIGLGVDVWVTGASSTAPVAFGTNGSSIAVTSAGVVEAVPEPTTYALMGLASLLFVVVYRRKARA